MQLSEAQACEALRAVLAPMASCAVMQQLFYQRRLPPSPAAARTGLPPGHAAAPIDLQLARPALRTLSLPENAEGYEALFGAACLGSPLGGGGALGAAARRWPAVERLRTRVALASALQFEESDEEDR